MRQILLAGALLGVMGALAGCSNVSRSLRPDGFEIISFTHDSTNAILVRRGATGFLFDSGYEKNAVDCLIRERYSPPLAKLDELLQLPEGSLGRVFAENMTRMGYKVEFFPMDRVSDDGMYLLMRLRCTHDIWHTVTGLGTDAPGELGLQGFTLAQLGSPLSVILILGGMIRSLFRPREARRIAQEVRRGYRMGKTAQPFLPVRFEDAWSRPLSEWRHALGIPA